MLRQFRSTGLSLLFLVLSSGAVQAESLYSLPHESSLLAEEARQAYEQLQTLDQINQVGLQRIQQAANEVQSAKTSREKNFYRLSYVDERAEHVKAYATYLITLLHKQRHFLGHARNLEKQVGSFRLDDQTRGLQTLLAMVMELQKEATALNEKIEQTTRLQQQVELYLLSNLLAMRKNDNVRYSSYAVEIRNSVYRGLSGLKSELLYLDSQLEKISTQEG